MWIPFLMDCSGSDSLSIPGHPAVPWIFQLSNRAPASPRALGNSSFWMFTEFIIGRSSADRGLGENREKKMKIAATGEINECLFWRPEQGVK